MEKIFDIPGFLDYGITKSGDVYSFKFKKFKKLKLTLGIRGYYQVSLYLNGQRKGFYIHSLMAITFLEHKPNKYGSVIDHINGNTTDNRLENLRIISHRENISIGKNSGRGLPTGVSIMKIKHKSGKVYSYYRAFIGLDGNFVYLGIYKTPEEASKSYQEALKKFEKNRTKTDV